MTNWKAIAIIFIILFIASWIFISWGIYLVNKDTERTNVCYYEICENYPQAFYDADLCICYDYDLFGNLQVVKQKYMK